MRPAACLLFSLIKLAVVISKCPESLLIECDCCLNLAMVCVGDLGQTDWTASTLEHIATFDYDVLLFAGDLSYADFYQPRWDTFGQLVSPYANYRPWMVTEGNHEIEHIPFLTESFTSYNTRWEMPYNESGSSSNLYYSFKVAAAHILMLGSYTDFDTNSPQFKWLQVLSLVQSLV